MNSLQARTSKSWSRNSLEEVAAIWPGERATVKPLYGDSDQNVLVGYADGRRRVLKISESGSREARDLIGLQVSALCHIQGKTKELSCPQPVPVSGDRFIQEVVSAHGSKHHAWMLNWLPGNVLDNIPGYEMGLLASIGRSMALVDHALLDFEHPVASRHISWDLVNILELSDWLVHIDDPAGRSLAENAFEQLAQHLLPHLASLPVSIIHNDGGNQHNMIVESTENGVRSITGVIDFGDTVRTHRICELGIAAAYATFGCRDITNAVSNVAAGYHEVLPIDEKECNTLPWLVMARFLASVCHAAERAAREPENVYSQVSAAKAWHGLQDIMLHDMEHISEVIIGRLAND